jgi:hypothetical protein
VPSQVSHGLIPDPRATPQEREERASARAGTPGTQSSGPATRSTLLSDLDTCPNLTWCRSAPVHLPGSPSPVSSRASHTHDAVVPPTQRWKSHDQSGRHRQTGQAGRTTSRCWQHTTSTPHHLTKCKHRPTEHTRLLVVQFRSRGHDTPTTSRGMMHPLLCCRSGLRLTAWKHERALISSEALIVQPSSRMCLRMSEDVPTNTPAEQ